LVTQPATMISQLNGAQAPFSIFWPSSLIKTFVTSLGDVEMKYIALLASTVLLSLSAVSAEAKHRWTYTTFAPWNGETVFWEEDGDDVAYYEEDIEDEAERYYQNRRKNIKRAQDDDGWWIEDNAREKFEQRKKNRKAAIVKKAAAKPKAVVVKPKVVAVVTPKPVIKPKLQVANLDKPAVAARPKVVAPVAPKTNSVTDKTIGCTAGAAVVTGYGFAEVKPKACTGKTYAYTAARAGKTYEIQMTAASGEIVDVKKVN
jgi:hypothetical protein